MIAIAATFGGTGGGGGGGVSLSVVIPNGVSASNFNDTAWTFSDVTCAASGGTPPYNYAWSYTTSSGGTWGFSGASNLATAVPRVTGVARGTSAESTLICTVTDSAGSPAVVASNQSFYSYENID